MSAENDSRPEILDSKPQMLDSEPQDDSTAPEDTISTDDSAQFGIMAASAASALTPDQRNALNGHNNPRKNKKLQPLQWDAGLTKAALGWAQKLARESKFYHSSGTGHGENLYWTTSSGGDPLNDGTKAWMAEEKNYHGQKIGEGNFGSYGHYSEFLKGPTVIDKHCANDMREQLSVCGIVLKRSGSLRRRIPRGMSMWLQGIPHQVISADRSRIR